MNHTEIITFSPSTTISQGDLHGHFLQLCYLFHQNDGFFQDDIVQIYELQGIDGDTVFKRFEQQDAFQLSRPDHWTGRPRYKLSNWVVNLLEQLDVGAYVSLEDVKSYDIECILHASVRDSLSFKHLSQASGLDTLLLNGSQIHNLPPNLFLKFPYLRVLDVAGTNITELPCSIGASKFLMYLNISRTPITTLSNSLCNCSTMVTLKLRNCLKLLGLPKDIRKLKNLQHLDVDVAFLLVSMPVGFGDLSELQSLPVFVVSKRDGCHITELKPLVHLRGSLRILGLENVSSPGEAREAALHQKKYLDSLELRWNEFREGGLLHLENLKPHMNLRELHIIGYGGDSFPSWIGDPQYILLTSVTIHDCKKCRILPTLWNLPALSYLSLSNMPAINSIDSIIGISWLGDDSRSEHHENTRKEAFRRLEILNVRDMPMLKEWRGIKPGDFPFLQELNISDCSKLEALPELSTLKSLHHLEITSCPLLESFPRGLPDSLEHLVIIACPRLTKRSGKEDTRDWGKLARIPDVWLDGKHMS